MIKGGEVFFHLNLSFFIYWMTTRVSIIQYLFHVIKVSIKEVACLLHSDLPNRSRGFFLNL